MDVESHAIPFNQSEINISVQNIYSTQKLFYEIGSTELENATFSGREPVWPDWTIFRVIGKKILAKEAQIIGNFLNNLTPT